MAVRPFKVGPDYIDPAFLAAASGAPALNLDPWAMRRETLAGLVATAAGAELVLVEGVTGLFDGAADGSGSTADLAAMLGLPVVLVVDARGMGASVAALVEGFRRHRADVDVVAVILNRVGSARHERILRAALGDIPVLGCLPREADLELPSRHLGLVQAAEHPALETFLERAAALAESCLDLDLLARLARPLALRPGAAPDLLPPLGQRIAVARDEAFAFAYPALLASWRRAGAELLPFSPLGRRGAGRDGGRRVPPGRLPGAARGAAGRQRAVSGRPAGCRGARGGGLWRVRRLHGAGRAADRPGGPNLADGEVSCRSRRASPSRGCIWGTGTWRCWGPPRSAPPGPASAATSSTTPARPNTEGRRCWKPGRQTANIWARKVASPAGSPAPSST